MDELEELNRRCIAAVAAEVDRSGDDLLDQDEDWVSAAIARAFEDNRELLARTLLEVGYAIERGERSDPDVRALQGMFGAGAYEGMEMADLVADVIYGRKGGVSEAIHDLSVARNWPDDRL